mmetsp:Transcript_99288/g.250703  ORF Transcript_99288/g.250703 Transcript_99288/m.250703 type:complete len:694 (-) Transcript_99288:488-2569(-)
MRDSLGLPLRPSSQGGSARDSLASLDPLERDLARLMQADEETQASGAHIVEGEVLQRATRDDGVSTSEQLLPVPSEEPFALSPLGASVVDAAGLPKEPKTGTASQLDQVPSLPPPSLPLRPHLASSLDSVPGGSSIAARLSQTASTCASAVAATPFRSSSPLAARRAARRAAREAASPDCRSACGIAAYSPPQGLSSVAHGRTSPVEATPASPHAAARAAREKRRRRSMELVAMEAEKENVANTPISKVAPDVVSKATCFKTPSHRSGSMHGTFGGTPGTLSKYSDAAFRDLLTACFGRSPSDPGRSLASPEQLRLHHAVSTPLRRVEQHRDEKTMPDDRLLEEPIAQSRGLMPAVADGGPLPPSPPPSLTTSPIPALEPASANSGGAARASLSGRKIPNEQEEHHQPWKLRRTRTPSMSEAVEDESILGVLVSKIGALREAEGASPVRLPKRRCLRPEPPTGGSIGGAAGSSPLPSEPATASTTSRDRSRRSSVAAPPEPAAEAEAHVETSGWEALEVLTDQRTNPLSTKGGSASPAPALRLSPSPALLREGLARPLRAGSPRPPLLSCIISQFGPPRRSLIAAPGGIVEALGSPALASAPAASVAAAVEPSRTTTPCQASGSGHLRSPSPSLPSPPSLRAPAAVAAAASAAMAGRAAPQRRRRQRGTSFRTPAALVASAWCSRRATTTWRV